MKILGLMLMLISAGGLLETFLEKITTKTILQKFITITLRCIYIIITVSIFSMCILSIMWHVMISSQFNILGLVIRVIGLITSFSIFIITVYKMTCIPTKQETIEVGSNT